MQVLHFHAHILVKKVVENECILVGDAWGQISCIRGDQILWTRSLSDWLNFKEASLDVHKMTD